MKRSVGQLNLLGDVFSQIGLLLISPGQLSVLGWAIFGETIVFKMTREQCENQYNKKQ
jgi:hypothetical protein